ncbi:MBL fold metallo-hydrolase [Clostridium sp. 19966]|uniref:MBL fold metallo-hydrolase n=1 Tax=Clostridium sp. 19966 TaxID=2768166 RepID=UPI0028DEAAF8|nr:MBL fold metallo-hydrolase [Clostridium sp. 19966]MDT8718859.1 MBL fold metallo-hydrolase [Clostridium sp. 19966]
MKNFDVKINYLYHSGFSVETKNYFLIFDYYKDEPDNGEKSLENGCIGDKELSIDKKIIVFSSHIHPDHFNPIIMNWRGKRQDIEYVLSNDIRRKYRYEGVHYIKLYEELQLEGLTIKGYGSTDAGRSFMVNADGINIFHAGDLNWWYWWDDTEEEKKQMAGKFKKEVLKIAEENEKLDIAFFPVDPRLKDNYSLGGEYFIEKTKPEIFIPMHLWDDYNTTNRFKEKISNTDTEIITFDKRGERLL